MKKNILMIGMPKTIIMNLSHRKDINIFVLEEKELYQKNNYETFSNDNLKEIILCEYINSDMYIEKVQELNKRIGIDAVWPARDYSVRVAANIAEILGVPGIGKRNGEILTNKNLLRECCEKYNIPHPAYKKINSINDLKNFFVGKPIIFKPSNRQASLGISKINDYLEIETAWNNTVNAEESTNKFINRNFKKEFIAEEFIGGFEVSVEVLVKDGDIVFSNITRKKTLEKTFVEMGHIVPAIISEKLKFEIIRLKQKLIDVLEIGSGILHSEWKVDSGDIKLIECAARIPGDKICDLISLSYNFNFYDAICDILLGYKFEKKLICEKISLIRFFTPNYGVLKTVEGIDILSDKLVYEYNISVKEGDYIGEINSSWNRVGYFILSSEDNCEIEELEKNIIEKVKFCLL